MAELERSPFSDAEYYALESLRQEVLRGERKENIVYQLKDRALITKIKLFQEYPQLVEPYHIDESLPPIERINSLVLKLDQKILQHPDKEECLRQHFTINGVKTDVGTTVNIFRYLDTREKSCISIQHELEPSGTYPYIKNEYFSIHEYGFFSQTLEHQITPFETHNELLSVYMYALDNMSNEAEMSFRYFENLIHPFLVEEK